MDVTEEVDPAAVGGMGGRLGVFSKMESVCTEESIEASAREMEDGEWMSEADETG